MDAIAKTITELATGTAQPVLWLGLVAVVVTMALLLGWASPLALWVEDAFYQRVVERRSAADLLAEE